MEKNDLMGVETEWVSIDIIGDALKVAGFLIGDKVGSHFFIYYRKVVKHMKETTWEFFDQGAYNTRPVKDGIETFICYSCLKHIDDNKP